jgi:hypothetical protein
MSSFSLLPLFSFLSTTRVIYTIFFFLGSHQNMISEFNLSALAEDGSQKGQNSAEGIL